jgi:hypothetical protein
MSSLAIIFVMLVACAMGLDGGLENLAGGNHNITDY